jgi:hypothetical protein
VSMQQAILDHVPQGAPVLTNQAATEKFLTELQGYPRRAEFGGEAPPPGAWVVILQRTDSEYWRERSARADAWLDGLDGELVLDEAFTGTERLRILRIPGEE